MSKTDPSESVRDRLLKAAMDCFLADDYHRVTTRLIAEKANVNASMIRYYFGNKEGLYEEMIRETLGSLLDVLDGPMLASSTGVGDFLRMYYDTMTAKPEFPKLILKVLALNQGPGRRFIYQLLERGRTSGARKVADMKAGNPPDKPKGREVEFSKKEVLREEVEIYRQPNHGCLEAC